jgi:hypothetical protein
MLIRLLGVALALCLSVPVAATAQESAPPVIAHGVLRRADGSPLRDVRLYVLGNAGQRLGQGVTTPEGSYSFALTPGEAVTLVAEIPGQAKPSQWPYKAGLQVEKVE